MNDMKRIRIDQILLQLLEQGNGNPFSTPDIRDLYVARLSHPQKLDPNSIRKHIYRQLLRLESIGILTRHRGEKGRGCKFIYRGAPMGVSLDAKPSPFAQLKDEESEASMDPATLQGLKEELSRRKVELVASIGEAEEYQRLYNKFPALQHKYMVRAQYIESRDRSTKLLGQLRAVETILADIGCNA
jgi:hypothetical protein